MSRRYTAQEMRETADGLKDDPGMDALIIADMLRQAADDMEREKKYEYAVKWNDGLITQISQSFPCQGELDAIRKYNLTIVRREVGEWEEVEDV